MTDQPTPIKCSFSNIYDEKNSMHIMKRIITYVSNNPNIDLDNMTDSQMRNTCFEAVCATLGEVDIDDQSQLIDNSDNSKTNQIDDTVNTVDTVKTSYVLVTHIGRYHFSKKTQNYEQCIQLVDQINGCSPDSKPMMLVLMVDKMIASGVKTSKEWIADTINAIKNDDYWFEIYEGEYDNQNLLDYGENMEERYAKYKNKLDNNRCYIRSNRCHIKD